MKFSIAIPAYKSQFLHEAIESVISQTYPDWELVIVDDCSPENLYAIVEPYLTESRIRYFRNDKNCGAVDVVDNWNICLNYCTGNYVICMGDDDRLLPCCLEVYKKLIDKHPDLNVYHARTEIINESGKVINLQEPRPEWESVLSLIWNRWSCRDKQYIGDFCYQTDYLRASGGYYKLPLAWGSDDITAAFSAKEKGIANTQDFCFQYRENSLTITQSRKNAQIKIKALLAQDEWYSRFFDGINKDELTIIDQKYLNTIKQPRRVFFYKAFGDSCIAAIRGNPINLIRIYHALKKFHYPKAAFAKWYLGSIYCLFYRYK